MKYSLIFIFFWGFIFFLNSFFFTINDIKSIDVANIDHKKIDSLIKENANVIFTPRSLEDIFINTPRSIDYTISIPLSILYNNNTQKTDYQTIQDLDIFLNIISKNTGLSTIYINKNSILIGSQELVNILDEHPKHTYDYPVIDLTAYNKDYFSLEYFYELRDILKKSTVIALNPEEAHLLLDLTDMFIKDTSFKLMAALNTNVNFKDKYKAQQIIYLMQHIKENPALLEQYNSPLNNNFFKSINKDNIIKQYQVSHNL
jgi:hypothetical protein